MEIKKMAVFKDDKHGQLILTKSEKGKFVDISVKTEEGTDLFYSIHIKNLQNMLFALDE